MEIGIFSKTFERTSLDEVLDGVAASGLRCVQFNLTCANLPPLPTTLREAHCPVIREAFEKRGLEMSAVSGTFNMAHPDPAERREGLAGLRVLAEHCQALGTSIITLCTGTRDREDMWRRHEDNDTSAAWADMAVTMKEAARIAEANNVTLALEPEVSNVVDSAIKARHLLDEIGSPNLKVVLDGANIFHLGELERQGEILDEACELLRNDIVLAHAKDVAHDGEAGHEPAGHGRLDYVRYLSNLRKIGYDGPLILHSLNEEQVPGCVAFVREKLALCE